MMLLRYTFLFLLLIIGESLLAQTTQEEINEQVWKPYTKAFNDDNGDVLISFHSKDLIRSARDAKQIKNRDEYYKEIKVFNEYRARNKTKIHVEFRFTERLSNGDQAIDVGVYKTSWPDADETPHIYYGKFIVVLRKENGTWKILVDTDSHENHTIGEDQFLAAKPME